MGCKNYLMEELYTFEEEHTMHTKAISWKQSFVDEAHLQAQRTNENKTLLFLSWIDLCI
jgi:hypothetical protein